MDMQLVVLGKRIAEKARTILETDDILRDPVVIMMLESADRQYKENRAIPLSKLIGDLGFEEDEL